MDLIKRFFDLDPLMFLSLILLICILRMVVPFGNYFFLPLLPFFFIFNIYNLSKVDRFESIWKILRCNFPIFIISFFVLFGFMISSTYTMFSIKEVLYDFVILFLCITLFLNINNEDQFKKFTDILSNQYIFFSIIFGLIGFLKLVFQLFGFEFSFIHSSLLTFGPSLNTDYNFYSLFYCIGLLILILSRFKFSKTSFLLIFILLNLNIVFSGSRRGIFFLVILWVILIMFGLNLKFNLKRVIILFSILLLLFLVNELVLSPVFIQKYPRLKNQSANLNSNLHNSAIKITNGVFARYLTIISDKTYEELNQTRSVWEKFNSSKINYDRFCNSKRDSCLVYNGSFNFGLLFWNLSGNSTKHEIIETPFGKGIRVSRLDGDEGYWALAYNGRQIIYYADHTYKLQFRYRIERGDSLPFNIGWWVKDGNKGYMPYALNLAVLNSTNGWKQATTSYKFIETHFNLPTFLNSLKDSTIVDLTDIELFDLDRIDSLPIYVDQIKENGPLYQSLSQAQPDLINNNRFTTSRTNRWVYSWTVFKDSLSLPQKIYGGGFDYHEMFGKEFGEGKYDYPHNPFLSAFLYSGIIGGVAYIWYMFLVFYYYIKYYKYHLYYFICFLVVFYFSFFSANTHFSVPIYAILSIIPFLTKYIVEKEKKNVAQPQN